MPDLVAIDLPGGPAFVDALEAAWSSGDAVLPIDQRLSSSAKDRLIAQLRPSVLISPDESSLPPLPGGPPALVVRRRLDGGVGVRTGDALVMATSGTTGTAKGVVLTHAAVAASAWATSTRLGVDPQRHRWLACLPLNHVGGLSVLTRSIITSTPFDLLAGFDAEEVLARSGPHVLVSLVATTLRRIGAAHFRTVVLGGSAPPSGLESNVVTTYGLTETGSGVVYDGVPLDGVDVEIDSDTSEIRLRGPMLLRSYRDGTVPLDDDGFFATGDSGRFDDSGRLIVDGRIGDMIISGGENVWPAAVEGVLRTHPGVAEVAVAGRPDPEWGQQVVAWVVPADPGRPPELPELKALVAEAIAPYAAPKSLVLSVALPKTSIGKVRRDALPWP